MERGGKSLPNTISNIGDKQYLAGSPSSETRATKWACLVRPNFGSQQQKDIESLNLNLLIILAGTTQNDKFIV